MSIVAFLLARIAEDEARALAECAAKRSVVELHKDWPVLVETDSNFASLAVSRQMVWLTEQEYRNRFGDEPPTGRIVSALAQPYAAHPDFDPAWLV